ncbi:MAG TPA: SUF system NifU family Fe-S cluster assembly protein [Kiritimatiellia bacterium]|nr:SUF system NifU family Fe-S cluster assembly protein [Kiritimatiellia bacterium]
MQIDDLYQEIILDHYKHPRRAKVIPDAEALVDEENPTCGDHIKLNARVARDRIEDVEIDCQGCAICTASASMMAERVPGQSIADVRRFASAFAEMMRGGAEIPEDELGDLTALCGVRQYPLRVKCATMPWHALENALKKLGV